MIAKSLAIAMLVVFSLAAGVHAQEVESPLLGTVTGPRAIVPGWNFTRASFCVKVAAGGILQVHGADGNVHNVFHTDTQTVVSGACQTGNIIGFHAASGGFNLVAVYPF
jgi:hypothetical protein